MSNRLSATNRWLVRRQHHGVLCIKSRDSIHVFLLHRRDPLTITLGNRLSDLHFTCIGAICCSGIWEPIEKRREQQHQRDSLESHSILGFCDDSAWEMK